MTIKVVGEIITYSITPSGIYGEVHDATMDQWRPVANSIVTEIRNYANNTVLIPSLCYSNNVAAWSGNYLDSSLEPIYYDCHQYGPSNSYWSYNFDDNIGKVLSDGKKVFLGEFGTDWNDATVYTRCAKGNQGIGTNGDCLSGGTCTQTRQSTNQDWFVNYALPWLDGIGRGSGIPNIPLGWTAWSMTDTPLLTTGGTSGCFTSSISPSEYGQVVQNKLKQNIICLNPSCAFTIN